MKKIKLTQNKYTLVDNEDFEVFNKYTWCAVKDGNTFYAQKTTSKKDGSTTTVRLHREIMKPPKELMIDHIDRDGLNNRRSNLRFCTNTQNQMNSCKNKNNTSGFKGVYIDKGKFRSRISFNGRRIHLGFFDTREKAGEAYQDACVEFYGKFANLK